MAKLKVAQCWDDGVLNDIRLTDLLRRYHAKATFNLNPGLMGESRGRSRWLPAGSRDWSYQGFLCGKLSLKDIAEVYDGFEVASHCWKHESADSLPVKVWVRSALGARHYLEDAVQKPCRGFAWPNGSVTPEAVAALRQAGFAYGRTCETMDFVTDARDAMTLPSTCHVQNSWFYQKYEAARTCGIFYFWGHSYELLEDEKLWEQLEMKLRYIGEDPDAEWVSVVDIAPFCDRAASRGTAPINRPQ